MHLWGKEEQRSGRSFRAFSQHGSDDSVACDDAGGMTVDEYLEIRGALDADSERLAKELCRILDKPCETHRFRNEAYEYLSDQYPDAVHDMLVDGSLDDFLENRAREALELKIKLETEMTDKMSQQTQAEGRLDTQIHAMQVGREVDEIVHAEVV